MPVLFPRLSRQIAFRLYERWKQEQNKSNWTFNAIKLPEEAFFTPVGGRRVMADELIAAYKHVMNIARNHGFPKQEGSHARFDFDTAVYFGENSLFHSAESLRDDVWSFVAIVMFPHVVHWRFNRDPAQRYLGGVRNTFQRLWLRARVLDRGKNAQDRWGLVRELSEDALVQITERPSIGADPVLARNLAEAWCRAAARYGNGRMESLMRTVSLLLRMRNFVRSYAFLPEQDLAACLDSLFDEAANRPE